MADEAVETTEERTLTRVHLNMMITVDGTSLRDAIDKIKSALGDEAEALITLQKPEKHTVFSKSELFHSVGKASAEAFIEWAGTKCFGMDGKTYYWGMDYNDWVESHAAKVELPESDSITVITDIEETNAPETNDVPPPS